MIRIRSKKNGFRRCGIAHSSEWQEYPDERFNEDEVKTLLAEPMLQVDVFIDLKEHQFEAAKAPDPEAAAQSIVDNSEPEKAAEETAPEASGKKRK